MTTLPFKFKILAVYGSIILLTACNQTQKTETKTETTKSTTSQTSTSTTYATTSATHVEHDMGKMNSMASSTPLTQSAIQPAYVTDYMQSMTTMHDQMMSASKIANPDVAFVTGMMAHHQVAVAMANIQLKYGKDSRMRSLADHIIKTQQAEIIQMQAWLEKHKDDKDPANATMPEMRMTHDNKSSHDAMMQGIMNPDPDIAFVKGMIPHHQGAIDMANTELKVGKDKTMIDLAKQIKSAQDPEIKQMQAWLVAKGVK